VKTPTECMRDGRTTRAMTIISHGSAGLGNAKNSFSGDAPECKMPPRLSIAASALSFLALDPDYGSYTELP